MIVLALIALTAQPNPYLVQAKLFQQSGDYRQCIKRIEQAQKWESSREEQLDLAIYGGLCDFALLKTKEAELEFKLALTIDPTAKLPPFSSPKAVALFESLRPKVAEQKPVEVQQPPPALAPAPSRRISLVPVVSAVISFAALGVGIGLGVSAASVQTQAKEAVFQNEAFALKQSANGQALGANISYGLAGAALAAAVIFFFVTRAD